MTVSALSYFVKMNYLIVERKDNSDDANLCVARIRRREGYDRALMKFLLSRKYMIEKASLCKE